MTSLNQGFERAAKFILTDRYADLLRFKSVQRFLSVVLLLSFLPNVVFTLVTNVTYLSSRALVVGSFFQVGVSLLLLISTRFVVFLPAKFLDERQIANRKSAFAFAFKTFVVTLFSGLFAVAGLLLIWGWWLNRRYPEGLPMVNGLTFDPYGVAMVLFGFTLQLALLFVALPIVHLAWMEAKSGGGIIRD